MSDVKIINELFDYLPHRYPFLLIDRVTETIAGQSIKGFKNVTANEELFNGHFPGQPILPGVLILEAMAQLSGGLGVRDQGHTSGGWHQLFVWRSGKGTISPSGDTRRSIGPRE